MVESELSDEIRHGVDKSNYDFDEIGYFDTESLVGPCNRLHGLNKFINYFLWAAMISRMNHGLLYNLQFPDPKCLSCVAMIIGSN
jgi:hypothetical protein